MSMIQFHILRNYAASNLNRDEIGAPKTAVFAGVQRGRISSQCLKRAWRSSDAFKKLDSCGIRTQYLPELVVERVKELADDATVAFAIKNKKAFSDLGTNVTKKGVKTDGEEEENNTKTAQLMFFSKEDIDVCAHAVIDAEGDVKKLNEAIKQLSKNNQLRPITLDIALFGRMITDDKFADVDASFQVAHALSTNRVNQESDYFTAVDDLSSVYREDAGAAHLGSCDFNSCCYYEYAALDIDQLKRNLKTSQSTEALEKLPLLVSSLIDAMIYSSPTGKQNTFAAHSLPSVICLERKSKKIPVSYINAFEEPIPYNYSVESAKKLAAEIDKTDKRFDTGVRQRLWFDVNEAASPTNSTTLSSIDDIKKFTVSWMN